MSGGLGWRGLAFSIALVAAPAGASAAPASSAPPPPPAGTSDTPPPPAGRPPGTPRQAPGAISTDATTAAAEGEAAEEQVRPADLSRTWSFARTASAPPPRYVEQDNSAMIFGPNPIGFYSGVSVRGNQTPPHPPQQFGATPAVLTWTGFERGDRGDSQVFFQLNAAVKHSVSRQGNVITIRMHNTQVNDRNNLRPLDLTYFATPVHRVDVSRRGKDTIATIRLKQAAEPAIELLDAPAGGYKLLVVRFGGVAGAAEPRPAPAPAR